MYGYESWSIKKPEHHRIDAFELWCWKRLLRVLWTARRSNQSILKEISPEYSLEGLMLKLKFQYFGDLMQSADSLEKTLMLGKIEGRRSSAAVHGVIKSQTWLRDWIELRASKIYTIIYFQWVTSLAIYIVLPHHLVKDISRNWMYWIKNFLFLP